MLGADHQQVALKLPADLLLDAVVHVRRVVRVELVDEDLLGQLDGEPVPVDGDLLHQLPALDPDCERGEGRRDGEGVKSWLACVSNYHRMLSNRQSTPSIEQSVRFFTSSLFSS